MKTYLGPSYWRLVIAVHGLKGLPKEITRIVTPFKNDGSAPTDRVSVDFTDRARSPDDAVGLASEMGLDVTAELRVPLASLRRQHLGIAITDRENNPFTRAVAEYLSARSTTYVGCQLQRFLGSWHPATLADFVGIDLAEDEAVSPLATPLILGLLPWEPYLEWEDLVRERAAYELKHLVRLGPAPQGRHGYEYFGPTSDALGTNRYNKYCRVAQSIVEKGFDENDHPIDVQLLQGDGDWALVVRDGKHRTTALAGMGVKDVVVCFPRIYPVVRRAEVETWPGVANGLYRTDQALKVFDRFVSGRAPFPSTN